MNAIHKIFIDKCRSCGECCVNTEMEISRSDIKKIEKKNPFGFKQHDFCTFFDNFYHLKNVNNYCCFFDSTQKKCKIYDYRPEGCRYYPIIYNLEEDKCEIDTDCKFHRDFKAKFPDLKIICKSIKFWIYSYLLKS